MSQTQPNREAGSLPYFTKLRTRRGVTPRIAAASAVVRSLVKRGRLPDQLTNTAFLRYFVYSICFLIPLAGGASTPDDGFTTKPHPVMNPRAEFRDSAPQGGYCLPADAANQLLCLFSAGGGCAAELSPWPSNQVVRGLLVQRRDKNKLVTPAQLMPGVEYY